jgi:GntR family transcriptional regulator
MMHIQLDFRSGQPIYLQIVEQIRQMVVSGELQPGDQLPTVRQLATDLRVNFNTVARSYRLLDEAGLISTQHGRGTYVWDAPSTEALQKLRWQGLEGLMNHCIQEALRQGYSTEEIRQAFERQLMKTKESSNNEEVRS